MSQMILPNQGEIKEIFPWVKKEVKQEQERCSSYSQAEPSFKNIFAKINQEDERSGMSSMSSSVDSMQKPKEKTPYDDEHGNVRGDLVNKSLENTASDQNREITSSLPIAGHGNTPDHEKKEVIIDVNLAVTVPIEKAAMESTHQDEKEGRILQEVSHHLGQRRGEGTTTSLQAEVLEEERPDDSVAEKISFLIKGKKGEASLTNAATNRQEQSTTVRGKGNMTEKAAVLAENMKKGTEAKELFIKEGVFKKTSDAKITAMPSFGADTKYDNSNNATKASPFTSLPSQEKQGEIPFATGFDNQNAGIAGEEELIVSGKESVPQGSASGVTARQVYTSDRVASRGVVIPLEQIIQETGNLLEKGGKIQLILHPPSLGKINMEVIVRNNRVELLMMVNNTEVQQVLQASSDQLKNALQNQGFQFDQMSVSLKRENLGFDSGGHPLWQNKQQEGGRHERQHEIAAVEKLLEREAVHYDATKNISIFV